MGRILLSICALVVAVGLGGSAQQPQGPTERGRSSQQQAGGGEGGTDYAGGLADIAGAIERAASAPETPEREKRAKDDVKAQRDMAFWALVVAIGTMAQVCVGVVGTIFLIHTLDLTRAGLRQTREANRDTLRAYVYAKEATVDWGDNGVRVVITVANDGQTPARWFSLSGTAELLPVGSGDPPVVLTDEKALAWSALGARDERTAPYVVKGIADIELSRTQDNYLSATGIIRYETIFGEQRVSEFAFMQLYRPKDRKTMQRRTGILRVFAEAT